MRHGNDWDSAYIKTIDFVRYESIDNPHYNTLLARYEKDYAKHLKELKEWEKWKKVFDEERVRIEEENDKKLYKQLKKKFEKLKG